MKKIIPLFICAVFILAKPLICTAQTGHDIRQSPGVKAVKKVSPAVVNISTQIIIQQRRNPFYNFQLDPFFDQFFNDFYDSYPPRKYKKNSLGSGIIVDRRGYILTNEHVILKASKIEVILADGRKFEGKIIGSDPKSDISIVKIEVKDDLPAVTMGDSSDLMIGETVIAIGNPFGLSHTVTSGVISALNRSLRINENKIYSDFIQTDASINPGNSGGPLLNINGELIGINTAIYQKAEGIGFAIPINKAKRIMDDLIKFGTVQSAWLGIFVQELTPQFIKYFGLEQKSGVLISQVVKDSPANKAGIAAGDIILQIEDKKISSPQAYKAYLSGFTADDKIKLLILSDGKTKEATVTACELPLASAQQAAFDWLGIFVEDINTETAARYRLNTRNGAVVTRVQKNSAAFQIGISAGDIVRQIGNQTITNLKDFQKAILLFHQKDSVLLLVFRGDHGYYVTLQP